jgi:hypothetical protein
MSPEERAEKDIMSLMERVGQGDQEACRELVLRYAHGLKAAIRYYLRWNDPLRRFVDSLDIEQLVWAGFFGGAAAYRAWR